MACWAKTGSVRVKVEIDLPRTLYRELVEAAQMANCLGDDHEISPERFAQEAVESLLASRRLERRSTPCA